jgi:hypothetical protein
MNGSEDTELEGRGSEKLARLKGEEANLSWPTPCVIVGKRGFSPTENTTKLVVEKGSPIQPIAALA